MKAFAQILKITRLLILGGFLLLACKKKDEPTQDIIPGPGTTTDTTTVANLDNFSRHLQFPGSVKRQGKIPAGPPGSSLKISIKDTLHLVQGVMRPIRFQHLDTTKNISGVYVQVHGAFIGSTGGTLAATDYFEVPEIKDVAESDTVSVILIGFDPTDLQFPLSFNITITPYNESGQPLDETTLPVKVEELNDDPKKSGTCGIVLPEGEFWDWELSYKPAASDSGGLEFLNEPDKVFGAAGQDIKGSCCDGNSLYGICPGTKIPNASLHFATYYQIHSETFTFFDNATFLRQTFESTANPFPDESDFCGSGPGVVHEKLNHTVYNGNWTITKATVPPDLKLYHDRNRLTLQTTSSTGGGYGNPGGIIHQLDCKIGELVLIQVDLEGFGQHLYKFYTRRSPGDQLWYPF